jgi:hypothetical protein
MHSIAVPDVEAGLPSKFGTTLCWDKKYGIICATKSFSSSYRVVSKAKDSSRANVGPSPLNPRKEASDVTMSFSKIQPTTSGPIRTEGFETIEVITVLPASFY